MNSIEITQEHLDARSKLKLAIAQLERATDDLNNHIGARMRLTSEIEEVDRRIAALREKKLTLTNEVRRWHTYR